MPEVEMRRWRKSNSRRYGAASAGGGFDVTGASGKPVQPTSILQQNFDALVRGRQPIWRGATFRVVGTAIRVYYQGRSRDLPVRKLRTRLAPPQMLGEAVMMTVEKLRDMR